MGGFDVFHSDLDSEGIWSIPVNIGLPINSTADDLFYVPAANGNKGYYTMERGDGLGIYYVKRINSTVQTLEIPETMDPGIR